MDVGKQRKGGLMHCGAHARIVLSPSPDGLNTLTWFWCPVCGLRLEICSGAWEDDKFLDAIKKEPIEKVQ